MKQSALLLIFLSAGVSVVTILGGGSVAFGQRPYCPPIDACPPLVPAPPPRDISHGDTGQSQPDGPASDEAVSQAPSLPSFQQQMEAAVDPDASFASADLASGLATNFGAGGGSSLAFADTLGGGSSVGYIDSAIVRNQVRLRFDSAYDNVTPDRAEFFYPQCGCFGPDARGPGKTGQREKSVDYQEYSLYAESLLMSNLISGFVEVPFRVLNPVVAENAVGFSDLSFGLKAALLLEQSRALTLQFRTFVPTGNGSLGLGTQHVTLEPGLLYLQRFGNKTFLETEVRDYIPVGGTPGYAGNVLRYGAGISHRVYQRDRFYVTPVFETVAWSVLSGDVLPVQGPRQSAETTIVNMKLGIRFNVAPHDAGDGTKSLYAGYGRAVTGTRFYQDVFRIEYRLAF